MNQHQYLLLTLLAIPSCQAFTQTNIQNPAAFVYNYNVHSSSSKFSKIASSSTSLYMTVVSPFEEGEGSSTTTTTPDGPSSLEGPLDLTWENVEAVLDTMRSYLIQDGGNVAIKEIDGPIVRLELQVRFTFIRASILGLYFCTKHIDYFYFLWNFFSTCGKYHFFLYLLENEFA